MKTKIRIISFMLMCIMLFSSLPLSTIASDFAKDSDKNGVNSTNVSQASISSEESIISDQISPQFDYSLDNSVIEVVSLREENVKHFQMEDGSYKAIVYGEAVHRKDTDGNWRDIDNRLSLSANKESQTYITSDMRTSFAVNPIAEGNILSINENGYSLSLKLITDKNLLSTEAEITNHPEKEQPSKNDSAVIKFEKLKSVNNTTTISYKNVLENVDLEYILNENDVKENIIVNAPNGINSYSFGLSIDGLSIKLLEDGSIGLFDAMNGELKYHMPAPYMYDAKGVVSNDVYYVIKESTENSCIIAVEFDKQWIDDNERVYPITIDPTINSTAAVYDTYIDAADTYTNFGYSGELWVSPNCTTFIKISMPSLPQGSIISHATLNAAYYYNVSTGNLNVGAYQVLSPWYETGMTWNSANQYSNLGISTTLLSSVNVAASSTINVYNPRFVAFDTTNTVQSWYNGSINNGIALRYLSGVNYSVIFKSWEAESQFRAYFTISYGCIIQDGVYSLQNVYSDKYMSVNNVNPYYNVQQYAHSSPINNISTERGGLFKITRIPGTGRYVIRSMYNNAIGLGLSGSNVITKTLPTSDSAVLSSDTFYITADSINDDFVIKTYNNTYSICVPIIGTNLTASSSSLLGNRAKWGLEKYTGGTVRYLGYYSVPDHNILTGQTSQSRAYIYSTVVGENAVTMYLRAGYSTCASYYFSTASSTLTVTANSYGQIGHIIGIKNNSNVIVASWYCDLINIDWGNGVYTLQNRANGKYLFSGSFTSFSQTRMHSQEEIVFARAALFKVINLSENNFLVRSMASNYMVISPNSNSSNAYPHTNYNHTNNDNLNSYSWDFVRTSDGYYNIIAQSGTNADKAIAAGDNQWVVLSSELSSNNSQWILVPYTQALHGVEINSTESHMMNMNSSKDMSYFGTPLAFYSSTIGENIESYVSYSVENPTGSNTNLATINSSGILTTFSDKVGTVKVIAAYSPGVTFSENIYIRPTSGEYFYLQNIQGNNGYIQDNTSYSSKSTFTYDPNQIWQRLDAGGGYYYIINVQTGKYITSPLSTSAGSTILLQATQLTGSDANRQRWQFTITPSGSLRIQSAYAAVNCSTMFLNIASSNTLTQNTWGNDSNYLDEFNLIKFGNEVVIIGSDTNDVPASQDLTALNISKYSSMLNNPNYDSFGIYPYVNSTEDCCLDLIDNANIYVHMAHAGSTGITINLKQTQSLTVDGMDGYDLSNLDLAIFAGCSTAGDPENGMNLPDKATEQGATAAVGFTTSINDYLRYNNPGESSYFYQFFDVLYVNLSNGLSLYTSCYRASVNLGGGFENYKIYYKDGVYSFYLN